MPRLVLLALVLSTIVASPAIAGDRFEHDLDEAAAILARVGQDVPEPLRSSARCVSVMRMKKGGFLIGGIGGTGWVTCRAPDSDDWSAPLILDVAGGSAGAQIGGQVIELVMIHMELGDATSVAHATPVFQGSVSATAGPEGTGASAGGDPHAGATVVTFSRSEGLYAGVVGEHFVIKPADRLNARLYGGWVDNEAVLVRRTVPRPKQAQAFLRAVAAFARP